MNENFCSRCQCCSTYWQDCGNCDDGYIGHECGEDTCCCRYPEDNVLCDICGGRSGWEMCLGKCDKDGQHKAEATEATK